MFRRTHLLILILVLSVAAAIAKELAPGAIMNPDGLQRFQGAAYNSELDEYLLIYEGSDTPLVRRLGVNGSLLAPAVHVDKAIGITTVGLVYNPDDNQYLAIYRSDNKIFGRYLDKHGLPLGSHFVIGNGGETGQAAYSSTSRRYLIVWRKGPQPIHVLYAFVNGDSTATKPVIKSGTLATGDNPNAAWGSAKNKFLVPYTREVGSNKEEVFGKLVNGNGSGIGSEFKILGGPKSQTSPQVGYASSNDVFLVSIADWSNAECCRADVVGRRLDSAGNKLGGVFDIVATGDGGWDVPGPIGFNEASGQFIATTYVEPLGFALEVDPTNGSKGPKILLGNEVTVPIAIATRPHPSDPQALVLSRSKLGGDGVHAHIVHLTAGPPTFTSTTLPDGMFDVAYAAPTPVTGGDPPLTYKLLSDPSMLAPGIKGPNSDTGIFSGKPTQAGTFGPFRVKVTDQRGRSAEADLTQTIGLAAPLLKSPISTTSSNRRPTFDWTPVPGATSYHLVVQNTANGAKVVNQSNIVGTTFTPASDLPTGKVFQWGVQASGGGAIGPFSAIALFEIDTAPPPAIVLKALIPDMLTPIDGVVALIASSEHNDNKKMENIVDGINKTSWMSEGTAENVVEYITLDLGSSETVHQIALRSKRAARFPKDFRLQISDQPSEFVTLTAVSAFKASRNTWYQFDTVPTEGRYIRILVTQKGFHRGAFWAEIAEARVSGARPTPGAIEYRWQAPADDEGSGKEPVVSYDLRLMLGGPAVYDYSLAHQITWTPQPVLNGEQSVLVQGLPSEQQISAALTSIDDAGNRSALSNVVVIETLSVPPGPITDLRVVNKKATVSSIRLRWTAPPDDEGDNSSGPVDHYDLRCSTAPISNLATFLSLAPIVPGPTPVQPGYKQFFDVTGLAAKTTYYCGLLAFDEVGQMSHSEEVQGSTN